MITEGINLFLNMLFAFNHELPPDYKWKIFCTKELTIKPEKFEERISDVLMVKEMTIFELERRMKSFLGLWKEMIPRIEEGIKMSYEVEVRG